MEMIKHRKHSWISRPRRQVLCTPSSNGIDFKLAVKYVRMAFLSFVGERPS